MITNPTKDITINGTKYEIAIPKERITDLPNIPEAQVLSDWNATEGMGVILNKPTIPSIAASETNGNILVNGEEVTVYTKENVELSVKESSQVYVLVNGTEIEIKTSSLAGTVGMTKNEEGLWVAASGTNATDGLASSADVTAEIIADELVIAAALNSHESRINFLEDNPSITLVNCTDTNDYEDLF